MNTNDQLQLGVSTAIRHLQSVTISAEDFSARQIGHFIEQMQTEQTLTVKKAQLINYQDLERLCTRAPSKKITFDFSEPSTIE